MNDLVSAGRRVGEILSKIDSVLKEVTIQVKEGKEGRGMAEKRQNNVNTTQLRAGRT